MKDNIEKLYELAKVEKIIFSAVIQGEFPQRIHERCYPPFTPEKQLELIKWFGKNSIMKKVYDIYNREDFPQALAELVCELWKDLTPEQKEEVRGILCQ